MTTETPLRKLVVTGKTPDGSHSLIATMYEPAEHIEKVEAYLLANGYDVEHVEPGVDAVPPTGHPGTVELHSTYHAHHEYLKAIHGDTFDLSTHVANLRAAKAAS